MKKNKWALVIGLLILLTPLVTAITIMLVGGGAISSLLGEEEIDCGPSYPIDDKGTEENAKQIFIALKKEFPEATAQAICGILGNFQQESQIKPDAIQHKNDPLSGHGIAQWTASRTTDLMNFSQEKNKEWKNLGLQIDFLFKEMKGSEKSSQSVLKATDVHQATLDWQSTFERAGEPVTQNRFAYADHWYAKFGTHDPASESIMDNGAQTEMAEECISAGDGDILKVAKEWIGWFHYLQLHPSPDLGTDFKNPNKSGQTDCSGYVWLVLNKAGYPVPNNMGWFTGSMTEDARGAHHWLTSVSEGEANAGDIVIVNQGAGAGGNGHTAILAEKWHGADTKIVQMGGNGDVVNQDTFQRSFLSLLNGGDVCFARAVKKGEK